MRKLVYLFDVALGQKLKADGYEHTARGLFSQSKNRVIWHALNVSFVERKSTLYTQPSLQIFCPDAYKIVDEGLHRERIFADPSYVKALGYPFITRVLYERVRSVCREDRLPFQYSIEDSVEIDVTTNLICEDFRKVAHNVFGGISTMRQLRDHIVRDRTGAGTGAALYAMSLTYLLEDDVTDATIDQLATLWPCQMTDEFADFLKKKIAVTRRNFG